MKSFTQIKRPLLVLLVLFGLAFQGFAQEPPPPPPMSQNAQQKIEAAKIGLISERLGLTPAQAQQFWPLYNEYSQQRRQNQQVFREARKSFDPNTATEEETQKMLKLGREVKERQLNLEQEYSDKLLTVINGKQLMSLQKAEQDFRRMLLQKLEQRRNQQRTREDQRRQNNERMRNKRNN